MFYIWKGSNATDLSKAIDAKNLKLTTSHSLYLGRELQRAEDALKSDIKYVQD
jgi:dihydropteroate synthase